MGVVEVWPVVGSEVDPAPWFGMTGRQGEKIGLQEAILMVTQFWPWVGKQDDEVGDADGGRELLEEEPGLGLDKMEVW